MTVHTDLESGYSRPENFLHLQHLQLPLILGGEIYLQEFGIGPCRALTKHLPKTIRKPDETRSHMTGGVSNIFPEYKTPRTSLKPNETRSQ